MVFEYGDFPFTSNFAFFCISMYNVGRDELRQSKKTRRCLRDKLEADQQATLPQLKLKVSSSYLHDLQGQPTLHNVLRLVIEFSNLTKKTMPPYLL